MNDSDKLKSSCESLKSKLPKNSNACISYINGVVMCRVFTDGVEKKRMLTTKEIKEYESKL
jgi:hypothetical protein